MPVYDVVVECPVHSSFRVDKIGSMFDVPIEAKTRKEFLAELPGLDESWQIGAIIGPSGSGKSTIARQAFGDYFAKVGRWPKNRAVIDCFPEGEVKDVVAMLTSVGFSSPPSWIKPFHVLSNGEQFRCELARALLSAKELCVFDEFTSVVDRTVAQIGSAAVAKTMRRSKNVRFVAVTCHADVVEWLGCDWVLDMGGPTLERGLLRRPTIDVEVYRVKNTAWRLFAPHHYLSSTIPSASKIYAGYWREQPVACVVVSGMWGHPNFRRISRLVVLPDYQGVGIGGALLDVVAAMVAAEGHSVCIVGRHPGMIAHCLRSKKWSVGKNKIMGSPRNGNRKSHGCIINSLGKAIVSFRWLGTT